MIEIRSAYNSLRDMHLPYLINREEVQNYFTPVIEKRELLYKTSSKVNIANQSHNYGRTRTDEAPGVKSRVNSDLNFIKKSILELLTSKKITDLVAQKDWKNKDN
ncbi:hypothetical protein HZH66_014647 [Vespula vulgaris]|uniref:Uncharacterized protein n=1 Tax=Vespula vulgaris TaxID=7454 RepID=A0A834J4A3_VESVU|nr:hypothetical protein HZH66_014647 [Vespula vulgaris]